MCPWATGSTFLISGNRHNNSTYRVRSQVPFRAHTGPSTWSNFPPVKCLFTPTRLSRAFSLRNHQTPGHRIIPCFVPMTLPGQFGVSAHGGQDMPLPGCAVLQCKRVTTNWALRTALAPGARSGEHEVALSLVSCRTPHWPASSTKAGGGFHPGHIRMPGPAHRRYPYSEAEGRALGTEIMALRRFMI